ncbi:hypothetical protein J4439_01780 [Candidatus Woesearchaeota archaeon]|nr:hypothetical protein [Candidatus Woesearchaeota archaeon]
MEFVRFNGVEFPYHPEFYGEQSPFGHLPLEDAVETSFQLGQQTFTYQRIPEEKRPYPNLEMGNAANMCLGCGHIGISQGLADALYELQIPPWLVMATSGIGCGGKWSSDIGQMLDDPLHRVYGAHVTHGQSTSSGFARGVIQPGLLNIMGGGDGDIASIGLAYLHNVIASNVNGLVFSMTNNVYGLTKGQPSRTSEKGRKDRRMTAALEMEPLDLVLEALAISGATFVARTLSSDRKKTRDYFMAAILHPGCAVLDIISPCVTWNMSQNAGYWKPLLFEMATGNYQDVVVDLEKHLDGKFDPTDRATAEFVYRRLTEAGKKPVGLVYYNKDSVSFQQDHGLRAERPIGNLTSAELTLSQDDLGKM